MSADTPVDFTSRALLHTVAKLHYEADLPQVEIARRLGLSTATVSRLLRRARQDGIVRIEVRDLETPEDINERLASVLTLQRAAVADGGNASTRAPLAGPVGSFLREAGLAKDAVLAIGWGRAVRDVITAGLPRLPGVLTVAATGGMQQPAPHFQVGEFVRLAAEQTGGTPCFIHAPYLPSAEGRDGLLRDPAIAEHLALWDRVDAALVGIGVPHRLDEGNARLQVTRHEHGLVHAAGDVIRHYFDRTGRLIPWDGEDRLIAMSPTQLRATRLVIGVASSPQKATAIRAAARAKLINALVTDLATARAILDLVDS